MKRIAVQAGHQRPLQPGHESQTGAPGEAQLVADIQHALVGLLNGDERFRAIAMPGRIDDNVQVDGAIFLHADGSNNASARGFSVGFPSFDVNRRLAHLIAEEIEKLPNHPPRRGDNNTPDMAQYYGFNHIQTPGPEVLVEHGFVTNPDEHTWLKQHVGDLAHAEYNALLRFYGFEGAPAKVPASITTSSALRSPARAPAERCEQYLLARPHGEYSDDDVRSIVRGYYETASAVGLDPLLVVAQMAEETAHLTSFWSQRPRRNPAGIGVTGAPDVGLSFPSWKVASRAHTGRLLAYSLASGAESPVQLQLIQEALAFRPLPPALRGAAPKLAGLAGTWAADPQYAVKLAHVANDIRGTTV
jgi:N-acetylmuramoyl-L-alanine amidase